MADMRYLRVSLTFDVPAIGFPDAAELPDMATALQDDGYDDGRRSFAVELIAHGLQTHFQTAADKAANMHYRRIHGNAMCDVTPTWRTSVAYMAAAEAIKDLRTSRPELVGARIEPKPQEEGVTR